MLYTIFKMRKHLKKYFVPHKHNQYHPHLFRNASVFTVLVISIFLLGVSYGNYLFLHKTVLGANIASNVLIDLANENRTENKIAPLRKNNQLSRAAEMKAEDMIKNKYFAHFAPDGTTPWYFISQAGYNFIYAGENLAIDFTDSKDIDNAWMNSPTHRANLLNANFKDIGIATKDGQYENHDSVYVVQMFGSTNDKESTVPDVTEKGKTDVNKLAEKPVKVIQENKNFIAVKSEPPAQLPQTDQEKSQVLGVETYSSWLDRFVWDSPFYIQYFFVIVIIILCFGMALRMIIEYRRQHIKHLIISAVFLLTTIILAILNLNFVNF